MNNSILCISNNNSEKNETVSFKILVMQFLNRSYTKHVTRKQLSKLEQHLLQDIGMSCKEAQKEANKAFWE